MDWEGRRKSDNVEDQRNTEYSGSGNSGGGGMLNLLPMAVKFLGVKGTAVLAVCIGIYALLTGNLGKNRTGLNCNPNTINCQ